MVFTGKWFILAVIAMFIIVILDAGKKYILDLKLFNPSELIIYTSIGIGLFGLLHYFYDKKCRTLPRFNRKALLFLFMLAILGYIFNIVFVNSINLSPDVTLVSMVLSLNIILIYLISSLFFEKSPNFNLNVFLGLFLILIGINIISKNF
jgi:drug/metabolite transporter (DMT)-like permease